MKSLLACLLSCAMYAGVAHAAGLGSGGPVEITSEQLDVEQSRSTATFSGNVVVTQDTFRLIAPKVVADYAGSGGDIKSITATGGVTITRTGAGGVPETATGTTALYTPAGQQIILTGAVTLARGPSQLAGDKLVYDMASGNARVTNSMGPVKARFVPGAK